MVDVSRGGAVGAGTWMAGAQAVSPIVQAAATMRVNLQVDRREAVALERRA